jgi:hypothetical protein
MAEEPFILVGVFANYAPFSLIASEERGAGSREQGAGSREQGAGSREQGAGSGEVRLFSIEKFNAPNLLWPRG